MVNKSVIIGTGSYDNVVSGNRVSITGDGGSAWGFFGNKYLKLAPRLVTYEPYAQGLEDIKKLKADTMIINELRRRLENEYIQSYYLLRLKDLDVFKLLETLYMKFGDNIILLCHEPVWEFCHRRLVADYIEMKTGIEIPEISVSEDGIVKKLTPIRYFDRLEQCIKGEELK
jgi:uncharacterized protein (DUF488 family)